MIVTLSSISLIDDEVTVICYALKFVLLGITGFLNGALFGLATPRPKIDTTILFFHQILNKLWPIVVNC